MEVVFVVGEIEFLYVDEVFVVIGLYYFVVMVYEVFVLCFEG